MKKIIRAAILFGILFLTHAFWLPFISKFLLVEDQFNKADVLVVLRGEEFFRFRKAAQLYEQNYASFILTSVSPPSAEAYNMDRRILGLENATEEEFTYKFFKYFNVPPDAVRLTGKQITSTYEEAVVTKDWMKKKGLNSMILVTSTYHMRRALALFRHVFKDSGIEIYPVTAQAAEIYQPEVWWTRERDVRRVAEEYCSLVFNGVYHIIFGKVKTSFDTV